MATTTTTAAVAGRTEAVSSAGGGKGSTGGSGGCAAGLPVLGASEGFVWVSVVCGGCAQRTVGAVVRAGPCGAPECGVRTTNPERPCGRRCGGRSAGGGSGARPLFSGLRERLGCSALPAPPHSRLAPEVPERGWKRSGQRGVQRRSGFLHWGSPL